MVYSFYKAPKGFVIEAFFTGHMRKERVEGDSLY